MKPVNQPEPGMKPMSEPWPKKVLAEANAENSKLEGRLQGAREKLKASEEETAEAISRAEASEHNFGIEHDALVEAEKEIAELREDKERLTASEEHYKRLRDDVLEQRDAARAQLAEAEAAAIESSKKVTPLQIKRDELLLALREAEAERDSLGIDLALRCSCSFEKDGTEIDACSVHYALRAERDRLQHKIENVADAFGGGTDWNDLERLARAAGAKLEIMHARLSQIREALGKCDHVDPKDPERHLFDWDEVVGRKIWNPMQPRCSKCDQTIGSIFARQRAAIGEDTDATSEETA